VSKVIRTGHVSGAGVVTLGLHEEGLHYDPEASRQKAPTVDLERIIAKRLKTLTAGLDREWEGRLREEHDTMRTAGERQLSEAGQRHQEEVTRIHQERYDEGHGDGVASMEEEAGQAVERMAALHRSMRHERDQILLEAETLVVDLALALARRVTRAQAEADPKVVARTIRAALENLSERSNAIIKVNADDLKIASRFASAWVERVDADAVLKVRVSDHVERGGCMVEGGVENVDARFESQLDVLQQALRSQMEETYVVGEDAAPVNSVTDPAEDESGETPSESEEDEPTGAES
jgi:flagellar assembly protein FliH